MGLGLFICRRAAELHNGKLELFEKDDVENLLDGASIGLLLPKKVLI